MPLPPPPPVLEVYYAPNCAPCQLELPAVAEFAQLPGSRVTMIIVGEEEKAREELRAAHPALEAGAVARITERPGDVLREAGSAYGLLPFARVISREGTICAKWSGRLSFPKAYDMVATCHLMSISNPPR